MRHCTRNNAVKTLAGGHITNLCLYFQPAICWRQLCEVLWRFTQHVQTTEWVNISLLLSQLISSSLLLSCFPNCYISDSFCSAFQCLPGRPMKRAQTSTCRQTLQSWRCLPRSTASGKKTTRAVLRTASLRSTAGRNTWKHQLKNCFWRKRQVLQALILLLESCNVIACGTISKWGNIMAGVIWWQEDYVEYSRHGSVIKGQEKAKTKSRYEEDVHPSNHTVSYTICLWMNAWTNEWTKVNISCVPGNCEYGVYFWVMCWRFCVQFCNQFATNQQECELS